MRLAGDLVAQLVELARAARDDAVAEVDDVRIAGSDALKRRQRRIERDTEIGRTDVTFVGERGADRLAIDVEHAGRRELDARGVAIGRALRAPALVTLMGDLGAGKTTLVQAICRGLGVTESVTSPTFALIHEYKAPAARVVHCDLYRLQTDADVASLGLDDSLGDTTAIVLIEWPERAGALLPVPTLALMLAHIPGNPAMRDCSEVWSA